VAWRIVQQPNGLFARFSEVVDDFTHYDMTKEAAIECCREYLGRSDAEEKVQRGIDAGIVRFDEAISIVRMVHGGETAAERRRELSQEGGAS